MVPIRVAENGGNRVSILITGGSSGIGRAIAEHFGSLGDDVYINYHADDDAANDCVSSINAMGGNAVAIKADVSTVSGANELAARVAEKTDRLDQVVHCAVSVTTGPLLEVDPNSLRKCLEVNPIGLINVVRALLTLLGRGSTVFYLSSEGALSVLPNYGPLGVSKALGEHIVRYLAKELAPRGVRILTVAPGAIDTPAFRSAFPQTYEKFLASSASRNLAGRALLASDVAKSVALLSREEFCMTTGDRIRVDGGTTL